MRKAQLFLLFAIVIATILNGFVYIAVQQVLRLSANDPQIQMAQDGAKILETGRQPAQLLLTANVNISQSLAPFIVIYSDEGNPIVSSGILNNAMPMLPSGVFIYTKEHGEDRITWQPEKGTRIAAVVVRYEGKNPGYILVGRNLREVEKRESLLTMQVAFAEIILLAVTLGFYTFLKVKKHI